MKKLHKKFGGFRVIVLHLYYNKQTKTQTMNTQTTIFKSRREAILETTEIESRVDMLRFGAKMIRTMKVGTLSCLDNEMIIDEMQKQCQLKGISTRLVEC